MQVFRCWLIRKGLKIIQSDIGFPASRLQPVSKNILAKLVEVFLLLFQTRLIAGVSTKRVRLGRIFLWHNLIVLSILDFIFPKRCVGFKRVGSYFFDKCISDIPQTDLVCPFCERLAIGGQVHPVCIRKYGLDGLWSLGIYKPPLKTAIQKLKYKWVKELASILVDITIEYWAKKGTFLLDLIKKDRGKNWIITSVPLHWSRKNWRGFNQSELIGKLFAQRLGLKYEETLKRIRKTKPQVKLAANKRKENVKGAFILSMNHELLTHNLILVDDVWTTGSTLKECCYILKRGGAKKVWALTLAR